MSAIYINGEPVVQSNFPEMTLTQYNALPEAERPEFWIRTDASYNSIPGTDVTFNNEGTTIESTDVDGAIKEVDGKTGTHMDLLWNNDLPTANTDYTLNSSIEGYKVILIVMRTNYEHTSVYMPVEEVKAFYGRSHSYGAFLSVGNEGVQTAPFVFNSGCLNFFVNATTFFFKYSTNNANWVLKPTRIYGIK